MQTLVAHPTEVWTLDINADSDLILTGGSEGELKAWKIDHEILLDGIKENDAGEVRIRPLYHRTCPNRTRMLDEEGYKL